MEREPGIKKEMGTSLEISLAQIPEHAVKAVKDTFLTIRDAVAERI